MQIDRREFLAGAAGVVATIGTPTILQGAETMYGLIGKMTAAAGQRDALIAILLEGINDMPGCLSYVVAKDTTEADAIWITEVWTDKASHDNSLALPVVKAAIARAKPLIAGFGNSVVTIPVGGEGLPGAR